MIRRDLRLPQAGAAAAARPHRAPFATVAGRTGTPAVGSARGRRLARAGRRHG